MSSMDSQTRWLDATEERLWRAWLEVHADLSAQLQRRVHEGSQLSMSDYEVLVHLTDEPAGRLRAHDLARSMQWDASRLSHHVTRMERRGLVDRSRCPEDRRGSFVSVTEVGRRAIAQAAPGHVDAVRRLFLDALGDGDAALLADVLRRLRRHLDSLDTDPCPSETAGPAAVAVDQAPAGA